MKPPPPRLPARGRVTASAKPTATAASTALPPRFNMSKPTRDAAASWLTTMPCAATTGRAVANREMTGAVSARPSPGTSQRKARTASGENRKARSFVMLRAHHTEAPPPASNSGSADHHHRVPTETRSEFTHVGGGNRDTAGGRGAARAREVEENRAAAALCAAGEVLIQHENQIVEMILAPHVVGAVGRRKPHRAIVARAFAGPRTSPGRAAWREAGRPQPAAARGPDDSSPRAA